MIVITEKSRKSLESKWLALVVWALELGMAGLLLSISPGFGFWSNGTMVLPLLGRPLRCAGLDELIQTSAKDDVLS